MKLMNWKKNFKSTKLELEKHNRKEIVLLSKSIPCNVGTYDRAFFWKDDRSTKKLYLNKIKELENHQQS